MLTDCLHSLKTGSSSLAAWVGAACEGAVRTADHHLAGAKGLNFAQQVTALRQRLFYVRRQCLFNDQLVWKPLMMEARLRECFGGREPEIQHPHELLHHL